MFEGAVRRSTNFLVINHRKWSVSTSGLPDANTEAFGCKSRNNICTLRGNLLIPSSGCQISYYSNSYVRSRENKIMLQCNSLLLRLFSTHSSTIHLFSFYLSCNRLFSEKFPHQNSACITYLFSFLLLSRHQHIETE